MPRLTTSLIWVLHAAYVLESAGQLKRAESDAAQAYRLAPANSTVVGNLAAVKSLLGLDVEAVRFANLSIDLGSGRNVTPLPEIHANAAVRSARYSEAFQQIVASLPPQLREAGGADALQLYYSALAEPRAVPAARRALKALLGKVDTSALNVNLRKDFIAYFTALGALDDAYEFANTSLDGFAHSGTVGSAWGVLWLPEMRPFRRDPRFQAFVTRLRLADYWRRYGPPDSCDLRGTTLECR